MKCYAQSSVSLTYYIKYANYFIKVIFEANNNYALYLKNKIPFDLRLNKANNYFYSNYDIATSIPLNNQDNEDNNNYISNNTRLTQGDIVLIFPDIFAIVHTNYIEKSNCIKIGRISEVNLLTKLQSFISVTFYYLIQSYYQYCISSSINNSQKSLTASDMTIVLYSRTSIPLNTVPNLNVNNKVYIKDSCYLKDNNMVIECNMDSYKSQLNEKDNKVYEYCNECSNMLDTGFTFDVDPNYLNSCFNYLGIKNILAYIILILIM